MPLCCTQAPPEDSWRFSEADFPQTSGPEVTPGAIAAHSNAGEVLALQESVPECIEAGYSDTTELCDTGSPENSAQHNLPLPNPAYPPSLTVERPAVTASTVPQDGNRRSEACKHSVNCPCSPVSDRVFKFFLSFGDEPVIPFPSISPLEPPLSELQRSCQTLIEFCTGAQQTLGEAASQWELVRKLESGLPQSLRHVGNQFSTVESFTSYVDRVRKWNSRTEGWLCARIKSTFGTNETGVFRSTLDLMLSELKAAGGVAAIKPFEERCVEGKRAFSAPWNSNAMKRFEEHNTLRARIVGVDVYCDGTSLSKSGSQSASTLRVRFVNIKGISTKWHEVGIAPCVVAEAGAKSMSRGEKKKERLQLFQRFIFLAFKDLMKASFGGTLFESVLLLPRVFMTVADQPQERAFFCLKGASSFRDCSHCDMQSRQPKNRATRAQPNQADGLLPQKRGAMSTSDIDSVDSRDFNFDENASMADNGEVYEEKAETFSIQTSVEFGDPRNVPRTVHAQLLVADFHLERSRKGKSKPLRRSTAEYKALREARKYLDEVSALPFPPALAAFCGLGTAPFHLYKSVGFDKLHAFDLGPLRLVPDMAFSIFSSQHYRPLPVSQSVSIANQRIVDIPRAAKLPKVTPFRYSTTEKQPGMSGQIRREQGTFLWVAVMGIARNVLPDDDKLLQACLMLASVQKRVNGVNEPFGACLRTEADIEELQSLCFETGRVVCEALNSKVDTKLHRVMRHIKDHLLDFGCLRKGSTDSNETMHKVTKKAYHATNHKRPQIALQLLKSRVAIEAGSGTSNTGQSELLHQLLLTRNPVCCSNVEDASARESNNSVELGSNSDLQPLVDGAQQQRELAISQISSTINLQATVEDAESAVLRLRHLSNHELLWTPRKSVTFQARLPWGNHANESTVVQQTVYAGRNLYGAQQRNDSVEYECEGTRHIGIIQVILERNTSRALQIALIRRLEETAPQSGNEKVVTVHNNKRYKYLLKPSGDCHLDCIPQCNLARQIIVVPDMYDVVQRHGVHQRMNTLPDTLQERRNARFYEVTGYQFTSWPEQEC